MSKIPSAVGNAGAQKRFIATHGIFLREFPELQTTIETILTKSQERVSRESDQNADVSEKDERLAKPVVFSLERAVYDDFGELLILAGNGMGLGATKILRSMYERLVTAMYVAKYPSEARRFCDHAAVEKGKIINRYKDIVPELLERDFKRDELAEIQQRFKDAKAREKEELCNRCNQPITRDAWTRVSLDTMARKVNGELLNAYVTCYLQPTFLTHATPTGLDFRVRFTESGPEYKLLSEPEAHGAVLRAHFLILKLLRHLNDYFGLEMGPQIDARCVAFNAAWPDNR